jgi:hypothetical protein
MSDTTHYEKDRAELASAQGFTGTFRGFVDWLHESLIYGGVRLDAPETDRWGHVHHQLSTVTAGFSSDEELLGRVRRATSMLMFWQSSQRGGLDVYEIPDWVMTSEDEQVWLEPDRGLVNDFYRVRRVRVYASNDRDYYELPYDVPVEVVLHEPNFDVNEPNATLIIRPHQNPLPDRSRRPRRTDRGPIEGEPTMAARILRTPATPPVAGVRGGQRVADMCRAHFIYRCEHCGRGFRCTFAQYAHEDGSHPPSSAA